LKDLCHAIFWQVISRSIPNTPDGACGFERNQKGWCFAFEVSPTLFGYFIARKLALEQLHLGLGVLPHNMVRGSSAPHAKPFLKLWIPADFRMFHAEDL
jgi:hypothetical protein